MRRLTRLIAVAALAAAPVVGTSSPAAALCASTVLDPVPVEVWTCNDPPFCHGVDTPYADASVCTMTREVDCEVALPGRPLLVCEP